MFKDELDGTAKGNLCHKNGPEIEKARSPSVLQGGCTFNKLTSVFHASVLLLIMNFIVTLSK